MSDLVNRLRGIYTVPVKDGAGMLDGKDTFTRVFLAPPISHEAADEIERLTRELAEARRTIAVLASHVAASCLRRST